MFFSIRYKFILALLVLSISCLLSYVYLVKGVFENDKEAAIFESSAQSNKVISLALNQHINEAILQAQSLVHTIENGQFSAVSKKIATEYKDLLFIALVSDRELKTFLANNNNYTESYIKSLPAQNNVFLKPINAFGDYLINIGINASNPAAGNMHLMIGYNFSKQLNNFGFVEKTGGTVLVIAGQPVGNIDSNSKNILTELVKDTDFDERKIEFAFFQKIKQQQFLSSYKSVGFPQIFVYTTIPKDVAYTGLYKLYNKSILFLVIIAFAMLGLATLLSRSLLKHLQSLTAATVEIGQGNFDAKLKINSNDEIGLLSKSFNHMSLEIKRLLHATREKIRMEGEIKTAQTIQKTLFPPNFYADDKIMLQGLYRSASECAGDWWYHFNHPTGFYLMIADATGHGVPAALITAAAKSAVSLLTRDPDLNIEKLVNSLNAALYDTAKGEILMTAFILHIDKNGNVHSVNASHEAPAVVTPDGGCEFVLTDSSPRLGQSLQSNFIVSPFSIPADSVIFLYTDGLTSQVNEKNREFGDKKLGKILTKEINGSPKTLEKINFSVFREIDEFKGTVPQNDDLTLVSLKLGA